MMFDDEEGNVGDPVKLKSTKGQERLHFELNVPRLDNCLSVNKF